MIWGKKCSLYRNPQLPVFDPNLIFSSLTLAMGWGELSQRGGNRERQYEVPNGGISGMVFELGASFLFIFILFVKMIYLIESVGIPIVTQNVDDTIDKI